jgi:alpha-1,2-mannosyltransferase
VLLVAVVLLGLTFAWIAWHAHTEGNQFGAYDFGIYRAAASALVHGQPVYDRLLTPVAPYSYPPLAALVAVPLLALPLSVERWMWMVVQLAAIVVVAYVALGAIRRTRSDLAPALTALLVAGLAASLPMRSSIRDGQVNAVLLCLVVCDALVARPRWPRGVLVGIAAAIKLTPALVAIYWLLTDRRRPALRAAYTFLTLTAAALLAFPRLSLNFWAHHVTSPTEGIALDATDNQSLRGAAERFTTDHAVVLWLAASVIIVAVGLLLARRQWRGGDELGGLAIVLVTAVLVSPIGWIHHMVVLVLVGAVLIREWVSGHRPVALAALVCLELAILFDIPRLHTRFLPSAVTENWFLVVMLAVIAAIPSFTSASSV